MRHDYEMKDREYTDERSEFGIRDASEGYGRFEHRREEEHGFRHHGHRGMHHRMMEGRGCGPRMDREDGMRRPCGPHRHHRHIRLEGEGADWDLARKLHEVSRKMRFQVGARSSQRRVMSLLSLEDGLTQNELAEMTRVRPATMSEMLGKLEGTGMVYREDDPRDRRFTLVHLTEKGKAEVETMRQDSKNWPAKIFECLDEGEKEQLLALLTKLTENWDPDFTEETEKEG